MSDNKFSRFLKEKIPPHLSIDGNEIDVVSLDNRSVTLDQYRLVRANSPGFEALVPKLNDEALIEMVENCLNNCGRSEPATYDYSLKKNLVPELIKRLKGN